MLRAPATIAPAPARVRAHHPAGRTKARPPRFARAAGSWGIAPAAEKGPLGGLNPSALSSQVVPSLQVLAGTRASPISAENSHRRFPISYTGRRLDNETGLHYFRARYFDAKLGRFVGRDPATKKSFAGTYIPEAKMGYYDGMSLYKCYFAPSKTDPSGMFTRCCTKWVYDSPYGTNYATMRECYSACVSAQTGADLVWAGIGTVGSGLAAGSVAEGGTAVGGCTAAGGCLASALGGWGIGSFIGCVTACRMVCIGGVPPIEVPERKKTILWCITITVGGYKYCPRGTWPDRES
jgi:RHS repeat-associated protein